MKSNLIERYVYDVIRRLPEKEREDVGKELKSNIADMLPEDADEDTVKSVLLDMGAPSALAAKYRQKPRYLISPDIYDDYIRTLKWVLPLVACIFFVIGLVLGLIDSQSVTDVVAGAFATGVSGAVQVLLWVTVGFIIADRTGYKSQGIQDEWKVEDLPEVTAVTKYKPSLSDSVAELILTLVFTVLAILIFTGKIKMFFVSDTTDTEVIHVFSESFLDVCIPATIILGGLGVIECIAKIIARRWSIPVCITTVLCNLIGLVIFLSLITRDDIFSKSFSRYIENQDWISFDITGFISGPSLSPLLIIIALVVVIITLYDCGKAIYSTIKAAGGLKGG